MFSDRYSWRKSIESFTYKSIKHLKYKVEKKMAKLHHRSLHHESRLMIVRNELWIISGNVIHVLSRTNGGKEIYIMKSLLVSFTISDGIEMDSGEVVLSSFMGLHLLDSDHNTHNIRQIWPETAIIAYHKMVLYALVHSQYTLIKFVNKSWNSEIVIHLPKNIFFDKYETNLAGKHHIHIVYCWSTLSD